MHQIHIDSNGRDNAAKPAPSQKPLQMTATVDWTDATASHDFLRSQGDISVFNGQLSGEL